MKSQTNVNDITVIGGGLIGMMTARELALAGAKVTLLERGEVGRESSWAGGGILSPLHPWRYPDAVTALARWGQERYPALAEQLHSATGIDPELTPGGLLWLDADEEEEALSWASSHGYDLQVLTPAETKECEPAVATPSGTSLWMPKVAQVRNPRLLQAMRAELVRLGVAIEEKVDVTGFRVSGGGLSALITHKGDRSVQRAILAGGAWTGELLQETGIALPVKPVRGQMILFKGTPGQLRRIVMKGDRYVIPRRDGRILAGSTLEEVGFEKVTTQAALEDLRAAALEMIPALGTLPIEHHWAGLRPGSPTGIPYIGEHPGIQGLYVNAGHFRNGVVLGYASARLCAELVLGIAPSLDPSPYGLEGNVDLL
jgi:glycine oxidase